MARVVEGFHSFTCTPTRLSANGINDTRLSLPSRSWSSFTDPGGMEGWVGLGTTAHGYSNCKLFKPLNLIGNYGQLERRGTRVLPRGPQAMTLTTEPPSHSLVYANLIEIFCSFRYVGCKKILFWKSSTKVTSNSFWRRPRRIQGRINR